MRPIKWTGERMRLLDQYVAGEITIDQVAERVECSPRAALEALRRYRRKDYDAMKKMDNRWTGERMEVLRRYMAGQISSADAVRLANCTPQMLTDAARYWRRQSADALDLTPEARERTAREVFEQAMRA